MRVSPETQEEFEALYTSLTELYSEYTLSAKIAAQIEKTTMAIYMYFRQQFTGGSEAYKRSIITAMKTLLPEQAGEAA
ncbi:hypothetical protein [Sulfuricurvum sp.]|uniref:hypothetical protein n=1 Tax=Sulfuricurvum sp. TaxID=2025608 RepID=UPI00262034C6|nr:hypothetical protein [Sulfuricurvum sp.]MDD2267440.1 hypothetical protein [Sulfuricurvum sp.]